MPIDKLTFATPQAYSNVDFSPLANLGQQMQRRQQLADLQQIYGAVQPDASGTPGVTPSATTTTTTTTGSIGPVTTAPFSGDRQAVAKTIAGELRAQGYPENAITGILYNVGQESNFNPTLRHPDQPSFGGEAHYAHGLFQEGGDEWNTMAAHLQNRNWQDPLEQARFVIGRLKGTIGNSQYADVNRALMSASSPEEAARIFASGYLKPASRYLASRYTDINRGIPGIGYYTGE